MSPCHCCYCFCPPPAFGDTASGVELLASIRERYTTVKRLVVRPAAKSKDAVAAAEGSPRNVVVEVQFTGPQPSEGPGALLCDLLCGVSVDAKPVELPRGRKKRARTDAAASMEGSDSGETDHVFVAVRKKQNPLVRVKADTVMFPDRMNHLFGSRPPREFDPPSACERVDRAPCVR